MVAADVRSVTFSECPEAYVPKAGVTVESDKPPVDDKDNVIKDANGQVKDWDHDGADICRAVDGKIHIVHYYGDMALLGRRIPVFGNTGRRALGKVGPEFQYKELEVVDGYLKDESSLHESAKGKKLVCKNGEEFAGEFGLMRSTGGHSYQYGEKICDYYLKSLGLPEIGGKGLFAA